MAKQVQRQLLCLYPAMDPEIRSVAMFNKKGVSLITVLLFMLVATIAATATFKWLTSYTHHPYGEPFVLEVPDNHRRHAIMNVPVNDMYSQVINALKNHHPVYWEGQMPRKRKSSIDGNLPLLRQRALERFHTTDQHAMAIVGLTKTKQGDTRFICKNSWGEEWGMKGYCLMTKEEFLINTILVGVVGKK